jgi:alkylation response protein AidB-like acyl-CoA dehydrogenase
MQAYQYEAYQVAPTGCGEGECMLDFNLNDDQQAIQDAIIKLCSDFDDEYWSAKDEKAEFPHEFHKAMAEGGWLGITMPEELGGSNLRRWRGGRVDHTDQPVRAAACRKTRYGGTEEAHA